MARTRIIRRRVTVVVSDARHTIHLIEVETDVRYIIAHERYRVDRTEAEKAARERMVSKGWNPDEYDIVGILVAHFDIPSTRGRITWAEEVETSPAVTV